MVAQGVRPHVSATSISEMCESRAVDAQLLCNSSESLASSILRRADRYVMASRALTILAFFAGGGAGLLASWHKRRIYRVWRLRHPLQVERQKYLMWSLAGLSVTLLLFLFSPVGLLAQHDARLDEVRRLDAIAVRALVLKRRYHEAAASPDAADAYDRTEEEWVALMRDRLMIDENV